MAAYQHQDGVNHALIPDELRLAHENGELIICVGPELDGGQGYPNAARLALELLDQLTEQELVGDPAVLRRWVAQGRASESLELLERQLGPRFARLVERQLSDRGRPVPELAGAIAGLRGQLRAVYSTGLDRSLERAFEDRWPSFATARPDIAQRSKIIVKLCGTLEFPETWVVTRAAFDREFGDRSLRRHVFAAAFRAHCLLFVAFELGDELFERLTATIDVGDGRQLPTHFLIVNRCNRAQRLLIESRGIRVIVGDAKLVLRALGGSTNSTESPRADVPDCPYPGLQPFGPALAQVFHGRRAEVSEAAARLGGASSRHRRWLAVEGPSGIGKSSFVHAGLVPALCQGYAEATPARWIVVDMRPGSRPFHALAAALSSGLGTAEPLATVNEIVELVRQTTPMGAGVLLVVDQLEELVTTADADERARFADCLGQLLEHELVYLLTTLRADFVDALAAALPGFARLLNRHAERYTLAPISRLGLRAAIAEPAAQLGVAFDPELVERIACDAEDHLARVGDDLVVRTNDAALPLVAHVLLGLWQARSHARQAITIADYHRLGGVSGALSRSADSVIAELGPAELERAKQLLLRLVKLGSGGRDTRRTLGYDEALALAGGADQGQRLLLWLSGGAGPRLLIVRSNGEQRSVDLVHEALLREWETLRAWIERDRAQLTRDGELARRTAIWIAQDRPWRSLPRGRERRELLRGRAHGEHAESQREFQRAFQRAVRTRVATWLGFIALSVVIGFGVAALLRDKSRELEDAEQQIQKKDQQARTSASAAEQIGLERERVKLEFELGRLLAEHRGTQAIERLLSANPNQASLAFTHLQTAVGTAAIVGELARHAESRQHVLGLEPDPSGRFVVIARAKGRIERWDLETLEVSQLVESEGLTDHIRFSPDGSLMAYGRDGETRIWDVDAGEALDLHIQGNAAEFSHDGTLLVTQHPKRIMLVELPSGRERWTKTHQSSVTAIAFVPGRGLLASSTTSSNGEISLWSLATGELQDTLSANGLVRDIVASPNGRYLASSGDDNRTRWWSLADLREVGTRPAAVNATAHFVSISPDGTKLATHTSESSIGVADLESGQQLYEVPCKAQCQPNLYYSFSTDGRWLLAANPGGHATLLDANTGDAIAHVELDGDVHALAFLPNNERFVIALGTGALTVWAIDAQTGWSNPEPHKLAVRALAFSPSAPDRLASGSTDGGVRLWTVGDSQGEAQALQHDHPISALSFSADGRQLAALSQAGTIRRWDAQTHDSVDTSSGGCSLKQHKVAAVSRNTQLAAIACDDRTVQLLDLRTGEERKRLAPATSAVTALALSHAGEHLLIGHQDGSMEQITADRGIVEIAAHGNSVKALGLAEHGRTFVSGGNDSTIKIWNVDTPEQPIEIGSRTDNIGAVAISPDGSLVAAAGQQNEVTLYTAAGERITTFTGHTGRVTVLAFSPDGALLASGSFDHSVRVWPVSVASQIQLGCRRLARFPATAERRPHACE